MASFADIVELRLRIKDPLGVIAILSVADAEARLAVTPPARQTAYKQLDSGDYYVYDEDLAAWKPEDLLLSDARLGVLVDLYGVAKAAPRVVKEIMAELGRRLYIAQTQEGIHTTVYQNLSTMKSYYKDLAATMEEDNAKDEGTSTGRYFRTRDPIIGGGMLG